LDARGRHRAARARDAGQSARLAGGADAFEAVSRALREDEFDEIIVAPVREERSRWRRRDLVHRIAGLGLPVTVVVDRQKSIIEVLDDSISMR
jgi:hypothetical protein